MQKCSVTFYEPISVSGTSEMQTKSEKLTNLLIYIAPIELVQFLGSTI